MSAAFVGGCLGFTLAAFSNGVRKLPLMRSPWEHVLYFGVGAWLGSNVKGMKERGRARVDEHMAKREAAAAAREARIAARSAEQ
ncbi:unnamed protein product [Agarophyton chilense]